MNQLRHCLAICLWLMLAAIASPGVGQQAESPEFTAEGIAFFETNIRPLLIDHCLECHGADPDRIRGGLWLTSRAQMLAGGDSGPVIVPGDPENSLLMEAVHYEALEMPPRGRLPDPQIEQLAQWIRLGAPDPRQATTSTDSIAEINLQAGRSFWAFQPLDRSPPIPATGSDWARTPIDEFILKRMAEAGLQPAAPADRYRLLRRTHMALTGLPPTVEQIKTFAASQQPLDDDLDRVIDQLLESPRFGERWGRHWLDVARFAESSGGGRSLMFPDAWRYRDYVVDAFNRDKPFDQMIREQLAGDLLDFETDQQQHEQIVATGFLTLGPTNYEQQDKELLQMEVIDEQVDTVGRAFLGLTLGCARCHDHKFDPIPTSDYYALAGIFGSTVTLVDGNVSMYVTRPLATQSQREAVQLHQSRLKQLTSELNWAQAEVARLGGGQPAATTGDHRVRSGDLPGIVIDDQRARFTGTWTRSTHVSAYIDQGYQHDDGQPKGSNRALFSPELETGGRYEVRLAYSSGGNRASNVQVQIDHQDGRETRVVNQSQPPPIDGLFVSLGVYRFEANNLAAVTILNDDADGVVIADAVQFIRLGDQTGQDAGSAPPSAPPELAASAADSEPAPPRTPSPLTQAQDRVDALERQLTVLKKDAPRPLPQAMSVRDAKTPADGHIHIRGSVRNLGEVVRRGFLQVVNDPDQWPTIPADASGRLQLAEWIASPDNPLTARVYVNRVWRHLFGRGLVETTDNFGKMGRAPTHPELLDYLAAEFVANGWSTKSLIRQIMQSRVFRLDSEPHPDGLRIDPENRLLWRASRRRVDAEVLRDSILMISGQLDLTAGGLTIRKLQQYDLGYQFDTVRRSVYVPAFRNSMLDLFEVFDMANPNMVMGHRNTSTLPTQALYLLNSPFVIDQAQAAARQRLVGQADPRSRLSNLYLQVLGRPPTEQEIQLSLDYLDSSRNAPSAMNRQDAWASLIHALLGSLDFRYIQ